MYYILNSALKLNTPEVFCKQYVEPPSSYFIWLISSAHVYNTAVSCITSLWSIYILRNDNLFLYLPFNLEPFSRSRTAIGELYWFVPYSSYVFLLVVGWLWTELISQYSLDSSIISNDVTILIKYTKSHKVKKMFMYNGVKLFLLFNWHYPLGLQIDNRSVIFLAID